MFQTKENPFFRHLSEERIPAALQKNDGSIRINVTGKLREALDFVIENQLSDRLLWAKFVEQYREKSDTDNHGWKCEYWGKMMRGAAFVYSAVGDETLYAVLEETVRDLLTVQEENGRFSTYEIPHEFKQWDMWGRKYILLGLQCFYPLCRDEKLKTDMVQAMKGHADYILDKIGPYTAKKLPIWKTSTAKGKFPVHGAMNSLSVLEPMVILYNMTGEGRYLDFAAYLVEEGARDCGNIFEFAYADERAPYEYPYTKAYEMMSCFEGLLEYAKATGSEKWRQTAIKFAYRMADTDVTLLGNAGTTHEFLDHSAVQQSIKGDKEIGQETCVSVTWMKLCARMLIETGDTLFADCFEQTLYNAYIGALNTERIANPERVTVGRRKDLPLVPVVLPFDSYTPLCDNVRGVGVGGSQQLSDGTYYGCCACIGSMGAGMAPHLVLMKTDKGLALQLYEAGSYTAKTAGGQDVTLTLDTVYPRDGAIKITLAMERPEAFTLALRIPSWSVESTLLVNGEAVAVTAGMTEISRTFRNGDEIALSLDMRIEALRPTPFGRDVLRSKIIWSTSEMVPFKVKEGEDHLEKAALRRGPIALAKERGFTADYDGKLALPEREDAYVANAVITEANGTYTVTLPDGNKLKPAADAGKTWDEKTAFGIWMETV